MPNFPSLEMSTIFQINQRIHEQVGRAAGANIQATMTQLIEQTPAPVEERWSKGIPTLAR
jgi:hypothetical protein